MWGIQDRNILACMCGVIAHESAGRFWPIHEFGTDFSRYGYAPSGQDYGGRGLIQTTWQTNYQRVQIRVREKLGLHYDLVNNPNLLLNDPELAAHAACVYWVDHAGGILVPYSKALNYGEVIHYVWGLYAPGNQYFDQYYKRVSYAANYLLAR